MLDIRFIRDNAETVQTNATNKGYKVSIADLLKLDDERRTLQQQVDELREKRNANAGKMKGGKPTQELIDEGKQIKIELAEREGYLSGVEAEYMDILKKVPNMASEDVPVGLSEDENVIAKQVGEKPQFDFVPRNHYEIGEQRLWIDKERAAKVAGSRFAYIKGDMVKLQMAIVQFVINTLSDEEKIQEIAQKAGLEVSLRAFTPVLPPLMIRT